jgi:hypothetical protein
VRVPEVPVTVSVYVPAGVPVVAGVTVSVAVFVIVPRVAVTVKGVKAVTALVLTVNVALVLPKSRNTLAGTVAADALLERETLTPLLAPVTEDQSKVTVPVEEDPPVALLGLTVTPVSVGDPGPPPLPKLPQE